MAKKQGGIGNETFNLSLAFLFLAVVASRGMKRLSSTNYTSLGAHANFFLHGVIGFLYYQNKKSDCFTTAYEVSTQATRLLALPSVMADRFRQHTSCVRYLFLASGLIPFLLKILGNNIEDLENFAIASNIAMLCYHSLRNDSMLGLFTAEVAVFTYFFTHKIESQLVYPLCLSVIEYCIYCAGCGN